MGATHFQKLGGLIRTATTNPTASEDVKTGAFFFDTAKNFFMVYNGTTWVGVPLTTSTSTSTSTTTTTSTTTSTTTTTTTSTSTSTTTSTTTS